MQCGRIIKKKGREIERGVGGVDTSGAVMRRRRRRRLGGAEDVQMVVLINLHPHSEGNEGVHLLVEGVGLSEHLLHLPPIEPAHLVELIVKPPEKHHLVLSPLLRRHEKPRLAPSVALRLVVLDEDHLVLAQLLRRPSGAAQAALPAAGEAAKGSVEGDLPLERRAVAGTVGAASLLLELLELLEHALELAVVQVSFFPFRHHL